MEGDSVFEKISHRFSGNTSLTLRIRLWEKHAPFVGRTCSVLVKNGLGLGEIRSSHKRNQKWWPKKGMYMTGGPPHPPKIDVGPSPGVYMQMKAWEEEG